MRGITINVNRGHEGELRGKRKAWHIANLANINIIPPCLLVQGGRGGNQAQRIGITTLHLHLPQKKGIVRAPLQLTPRRLRVRRKRGSWGTGRGSSVVALGSWSCRVVWSCGVQSLSRVEGPLPGYLSSMLPGPQTTMVLKGFQMI